MNIKTIVRAVSVAALLAGASVSASAATILDGWSLTLPGGTVSNIGRMNLISGLATVTQELDATGNVFVGAKFIETGAIQNITFTTESAVGGGDGGPVQIGNTLLQLTFTDVMGHVTALNASGSGFQYVFDSGSYTLSPVSNLANIYASGSIIGVGGNASSTAIIGGFNGDSTLLGTVDFLGAGVVFRDKDGNDLSASLANGSVLYEAVTNNNLTNVVSLNAPCGFATQAGSFCTSFNVASGGDAYLVRQVPEPGSLALAGLALLGVGAARRRRSV